MASFYTRHLFICINQREDGSQCCANYGSAVAHAHAKRRLKLLGLNGPGQMRANRAGCMDRCSEGPIAVVYPEGVWYRYDDLDDIDEIIDRHLVAGELVERLRLPEFD